VAATYGKLKSDVLLLGTDGKARDSFSSRERRSLRRRLGSGRISRSGYTGELVSGTGDDPAAGDDNLAAAGEFLRYRGEDLVAHSYAE
jgi:hypothetical protein